MKKTKNTQSFQEDKKPKVFQLWWFDKEEKRHFPAGVAFHEDNFGEYRLKIDMHPENQYYLKPILSTGRSNSLSSGGGHQKEWKI